MNNKQRLFEVMQKINPDFKTNLNESKLYVKSSEIPQQIIMWAKSIIGNSFQNKITIEKVNDKLTIGMPWHNADKETHQFFKLTENGAEPVGNPVSRSGWSEVNSSDKYGTIEIPSGYILATVGTYPKRLEINVNENAQDFLPSDNGMLNKLSDDEMVALNNAASLKSFARQKFDNSVYRELMSLGLINSQKAITIDGRNLIKSPEAIERLKKIQDKDREENGWSPKYKITINEVYIESEPKNNDWAIFRIQNGIKGFVTQIENDGFIHQTDSAVKYSDPNVPKFSSEEAKKIIKRNKNLGDKYGIVNSTGRNILLWDRYTDYNYMR